jgi:hypothetical protein
MKFLLSALLLSSFSAISAQYGINFRYAINDYSELNNIVTPQNDNKVFHTSFEVGIDYWARLKNYRIEFFPEISVNTSKTNINQFEIDYLQKTGLKFLVNTRFYPFDFLGDCDCPTFSKQGNWLSKGFFLFVGPGLNWEKYEGNIDVIDMNNFTWSIGTGIGLDVGINDFITLSPSIAYRYNSNVDWKELARMIGITNLEFNYTQIQFGLRIGIRFDYINNQRRR